MNKLSMFFLCIFAASCAYTNDSVTNEVAAWTNSHSISYSNSKNSQEEISQPSQFIQTKNPYIGYANIDYLLWASKRTDMFYELRDFVQPIVKGDMIGKLKTIKPKWSSGARAEVGFSNIYDWMISGIFTYYANTNKYHQKPSETDVILFLNPNSIRSSLTSFKLRYWTADIDFSTLFNLSKSTTFKPFITLRGAHFHYKIQYNSTNIDLDDPEIEFFFNIKIPYSFTGFGPRAGFSTYYKCGNTGLNFWGSLSTSLLYGKVKTHEEYSRYEEQVLLIAENYRCHFKDLKANLQLQLGAEWKGFFDHDKKAIVLRANWETNYWWDLDNYFNDIEAFGDRSLILYGVNFGIGLEF
jgi:hypothetical protein